MPHKAIENISCSLVIDHLEDNGHAEIASSLRELKSGDCDLLNLHGLKLDNIVHFFNVEQQNCNQKNVGNDLSDESESEQLDRSKSDQEQVGRPNF